MLVFMKRDFQVPAEGVGDSAQGSEAGHVLAALEPRNHRFRHSQSRCKLLLGFAGGSPQLRELTGKNRRNGSG